NFLLISGVKYRDISKLEALAQTLPLSCDSKAVKVLRIVPGNPALVDFGDVLPAGEHFYRVGPGRIPVRIVRRIQKLAGADTIDHVGHRRFLQFKSIEE